MLLWSGLRLTLNPRRTRTAWPQSERTTIRKQRCTVGLLAVSFGWLRPSARRSGYRTVCPRAGSKLKETGFAALVAERQEGDRVSTACQR
jgi:hypothetical protein